MKILFLLKERHYNENALVKSYGLINSSKQLAEYLNTLGHRTRVVTVIDGNFIDKEIHDFKPDMVIIEALWVAADKLKELMEIRWYKRILWVVRVHSDVGFLSAETLALKYINDYIALKKHNLLIAPNNKAFTLYLSNCLRYRFVYLPNVMSEVKYERKPVGRESYVINIGCFGALRVLKNQVFQAMCAMGAADALHRRLRFHVTAGLVVEGKVNPVLKNLEELFRHSEHELIVHPWQENEQLQRLIRKMDIGLQLSYSESFNIITSDFIHNDVLILVSDAISWMPRILRTSTVDYDNVVRKIMYLYEKRNSCFLRLRMYGSLSKYNTEAKREWRSFLRQIRNLRGLI